MVYPNNYSSIEPQEQPAEPVAYEMTYAEELAKENRDRTETIADELAAQDY